MQNSVINDSNQRKNLIFIFKYFTVATSRPLFDFEQQIKLFIFKKFALLLLQSTKLIHSTLKCCAFEGSQSSYLSAQEQRINLNSPAPKQDSRQTSEQVNPPLKACGSVGWGWGRRRGV